MILARCISRAVRVAESEQTVAALYLKKQAARPRPLQQAGNRSLGRGDFCLKNFCFFIGRPQLPEKHLV